MRWLTHFLTASVLEYHRLTVNSFPDLSYSEREAAWIEAGVPIKCGSMRNCFCVVQHHAVHLDAVNDYSSHTVTFVWAVERRIFDWVQASIIASLVTLALLLVGCAASAPPDQNNHFGDALSVKRQAVWPENPPDQLEAIHEGVHRRFTYRHYAARDYTPIPAGENGSGNCAVFAATARQDFTAAGYTSWLETCHLPNGEGHAIAAVEGGWISDTLHKRLIKREDQECR